MTHPGMGRWWSWPAEMASVGRGCRSRSALSVTVAAGSPGSGAIATCLFLLYLSGQAPSWLSTSPRRDIAVVPPLCTGVSYLCQSRDGLPRDMVGQIQDRLML